MDGPSTSSTKTPRRRSAKKATASCADQLNSSESDWDMQSPSAPSSKRGVSAGKKHMKKRPRSASMKEVAPSLAQKPSSSSADHVEPRTGRRFSSPSIALAPPPVTQRPRPPVEEPTIDVDVDNLSDLSSLTTLSSRSASPIPDPLPQEKPSVKSHPFAQELKAVSKLPKPPNETSWSLAGLGTYVWVLLEHGSGRVFNPSKDERDGRERIWWPAKVLSDRSTKVPLKVQLFQLGEKIMNVHGPCENNILSRYCNGKPRFESPTFMTQASMPASSDIEFASPRKKQKRDLAEVKREWERATAQLTNQDSAEEEEPPDMVQAFFKTVAPTSTSIATPVTLPASQSNFMKGKRKQKAVQDDHVWEPDPPPVDLDIPGELVLARDQTSESAEYWPARITEYLTPANRKQAPKFKVVFLDNSVKDIPRPWFYTMQEDEFATCKLGKFESSFVEVQNDEDGDEHNHLENVRDQARRSSSPAPLDPPPALADFVELSIREQFVYTKCVLKAILSNEYEPARQKFAKYMSGGRHRTSVVNTAGARGKMDPSDVEYLQVYIREWCLREEGIFEAVVNDEDEGNGDSPIPAPLAHVDANTVGDMDIERPTPPIQVMPSSPPEFPPPSSSLSSMAGSEREAPPVLGGLALRVTTDLPSTGSDLAAPPTTATEFTVDNIDDDLSDLTTLDGGTSLHISHRPPRPTGCEQYELLSPLDKVDFCLNILLPEAIRQVLLWRAGDRVSVDLLSPEEEGVLYDRGGELLQETDWVFDIMRYRNMMVQRQNTKKRLKTQGQGWNGGASTRPRRDVGIAKYQE